MPIETAKYNGYAVYCNGKKPLGVVSADGERTAICNMPVVCRITGTGKVRVITAYEDKPKGSERRD